MTSCVYAKLSRECRPMTFQGELWLPENLPRQKRLDVVPLCRRVLVKWARYTQTSLSPEDFEEAHAFLVKAAWQLSQRWDPNRGVGFDAHLHSILPFRVTDWLRGDEGRTKWAWATHTYERAREQKPLSLDAGSGEDARTLGDLLAEAVGPDSASLESSLGWLERTRDSSRSGDVRLLRQWMCEADEGRTEPLERSTV